MIREIENRRSIRKYKLDEIERKLVERDHTVLPLHHLLKTGSLGNLLYIRGKKKR